jgi:hypothetical protein
MFQDKDQLNFNIDQHESKCCSGTVTSLGEGAVLEADLGSGV